MATSAKRYGLEVEGNLELELRLRRIEVELEKKVDANPDGVAAGRSRSSPPQVTGIRVSGRTPGQVTIAWNASPVSDLRRYDVEFAEDTAFTENKQTFREQSTQYVFNTTSSEGGTGGTVVFARVRAVNSILTEGPYSAILNTSTGEVESGDIGDDAIGTEQIQDGAVTDEKTVTGALPPDFSVSDALQFMRVNATGTELEYAYELPLTPTNGSYLRGDGTDVVLQTGTLPDVANVGNTGDYLRVAGADSIGFASGTLPPEAGAGDAGSLIRVTGADNLDYTTYEFPSAATADRFITGDGTNFVLTSLAPADGGAQGSNSNRTGSITIPGGFVLEWGTIDLVDSTDTNIGGLTNRVVSAVASSGEGGTPTPVAAWVSSATQITLRQESGANKEATWFAISD